MIEMAQRLADWKCIDLTDQDLKYLRRVAIKQIPPYSRKLADWLHSWAQTEEFWRADNPTHRPAPHLLGVPPLVEWTNSELAGALRGTTAFFFLAGSESSGLFADRLAFAIAHEAAQRLEATDAVG